MRVLVADAIADDAVALLREAHEVDVVHHAPDALREEIQKYDAVLVRSKTKLPRDVLERAERLRIIGRAGVGVDNIDLEAAKEKGVAVVNAPDASSNAVAELALAHMLALARHLPEADATTKAGGWEKKRLVGIELAGRTLGLVGMGRIGSRLAGFAKALDMRIVAFDPYVTPEQAAERGITKVEDVLDVAREADFVSVHTPLTPDTRGIVGADFLAAMRPTGHVLNCARGGVVDEPALTAALEEGRIRGAALDVFETEPPEGNPLLKARGLHVTPHVGANTSEAQTRAGTMVAEAVLQYLQSGDAPNRVV